MFLKFSGNCSNNTFSGYVQGNRFVGTTNSNTATSFVRNCSFGGQVSYCTFTGALADGTEVAAGLSYMSFDCYANGITFVAQVSDASAGERFAPYVVRGKISNATRTTVKRTIPMKTVVWTGNELPQRILERTTAGDIVDYVAADLALETAKVTVVEESIVTSSAKRNTLASWNGEDTETVADDKPDGGLLIDKNDGSGMDDL